MRANHNKQSNLQKGNDADGNSVAARDEKLKSAKSNVNPSWWRDDAHGRVWDEAGEEVRHSWDHALSLEPVGKDGIMSDGGNIAGDDLSHGKVDPVINASGRDRGANGGETQFNQAMPTRRGQEDNAKTAIHVDLVSQPAVRGESRDPRHALDNEALRFGVGARREFGEKYPKWNDELEQKLRADWSADADDDFEAVKRQVRHGYENQDHRTKKPRS